MLWKLFDEMFKRNIIFLDSDVFWNWDNKSDLYSTVPTKFIRDEKKKDLRIMPKLLLQILEYAYFRSICGFSFRGRYIIKSKLRHGNLFCFNFKTSQVHQTQRVLIQLFMALLNDQFLELISWTMIAQLST